MENTNQIMKQYILLATIDGESKVFKHSGLDLIMKIAKDTIEQGYSVAITSK